MTRPGYSPIPTRGHPSVSAAVRDYDARWPDAPAREVAWMLGLSVQEVANVRAQDAIRGLPQRRAVRLTSAEYTRECRARQSERAARRAEGRAA